MQVSARQYPDRGRGGPGAEAFGAAACLPQWSPLAEALPGPDVLPVGGVAELADAPLKEGLLRVR